MIHVLFLRTIIRCCQRLGQVAQDKTLWRRVDFRASPVLSKDLRKYIRFLQPMTTSLAIRGNLYSDGKIGLSSYFFSYIRFACTQLKELVIEKYYINGDKVRLNIELFLCGRERSGLLKPMNYT